MAGCGICGTDLHFFRGDFPSPVGLLPGHEIGGVVDEVGADVALAKGTPVAVEPLVGCGQCPACVAGAYNQCPERRLLGVNARGGLAELLVAPASSLHPLPAGVPPEAGALVEPLAVCVRGARLAGVGLGSRVAVLGAGTIGLLSVLVARAAGASRVIATARHASQRERALALGADSVFGSGEEAAKSLAPFAVDVVIETVGGTAETIAEAVRLVRPGGAIGMLGVFAGDPSLPGLLFSTKEVRLFGSNCYARADARSDFAIASDLLADRLEAIGSLVTHRFPLAEVNRAFEVARDKASGSIKVALHP
jgi:threonine dehydrogenase-like Zn-dependent dehydrogenase